ncbi:MAG TPA: hypothetical protein VF624_17870 [Tepidisphaeraceae bacterium]|jgi:hypothetical protein
MLAETFPDLASFGVAGLMGAMWLWERRTSAERETQISNAHERILADGVKLEALMDLVEKNTDALSRLLAANDQVLRKLEDK